MHSVIRVESFNYNPPAVSPKGAQGLMPRLIPATARRFGVSDTFVAAENIQGGVRYLRFLLDYYQNDYTKSIAAFNAGEAAVDKYNGVPPCATKPRATCGPSSQRIWTQNGNLSRKPAAPLRHSNPDPACAASHSGIHRRRRNDLLQDSLRICDAAISRRAAAVFLTLPVIAAPNPGIIQVTGLRAFSHPGSTRIIVETTGPAEFHADRAHDPDRLYFDILRARPHGSIGRRVRHAGDWRRPG